MSLYDTLYYSEPTRAPFFRYMHDPARDYWYVFIASAVLYAIGIPLLQKLMKRRAPYNFKFILVSWNLLLCVLSAIGALIVNPYLLLLLRDRGLMYVICSEDWQKHPVVTLTISLFLWSKIPELMDTVWLALKKREIILLHWYHHVTVLLYCWWGGWHNNGGTGLFFSGMNMFVHAVMYGYYALSAMGKRPPFPYLITILQIVQMMIGTYVVVKSIPCAQYSSNYYSALIMYSSYLLLFILFFLNKHVYGDKVPEDVRVSKDKIF